ncbi:tRNA wybutosine-synthesis-related protein 2 [Parastagonospora nodorum]|nr:tRNA wybutosine-synthesis-related protein 2 [Parastagonospora nodorum]KAH4307397.1 tRNA wybutosine-synthesis-related protein 2 [Parastagonospora nodorum]KAH4322867.1 tRNA wybutosine-synthesis-related protein 2 [Parastagonospora nodorum]KAH4359336.1 tRNA wybutosine-synthesis-related protein 2 [Parastagonospora nodorum]KAH4453018.1 tRNA wybutosine-synthesis-related protein 2 [Parastagonospora nodorum]
MDQEMEESEPMGTRLILVVPRQHVKTVKTALEEHGQLDRNTKILPEENIHGSDCSKSKETENSEDVADNSTQPAMRIPTTIHSNDTSTLSTTLTNLNLQHLSSKITLSQYTPSTTSIEKNPLCAALSEVLTLLPPSILSALNLTPHRLAAAFPDAYSIYPPLLLLPHNAFSSPLWRALLTAHPASAASLQPLWRHVAQKMGVSHIAINSPIPLQNGENTMRSPVNITPIYGSFGPSPSPRTLSHPSPADFDKALWASACQNGITQFWAPMYTMFSRGNIREKTRILTFPSQDAGSVVDMYAGIGYFTLPYRRRGFSPIICFEVNPWSVEGLRRGCVANNYSYKIFTRMDMHEWDEEDFTSNGETVKDVYIFHLSNTHARPLLAPHIPSLPPVRHVNLGLLPSSRDSWRDAVGLVSREGGWVHAHENVGVGEVESRRGEVEMVFQAWVDEMDGDGGWEGIDRVVRRKAEVRHVERVKMYAPGVVHCVFDVWVEGRGG